MITDKIKAKKMTKHILCDCKIKINSPTSKSNQKY